MVPERFLAKGTIRGTIFMPKSYVPARASGWCVRFRLLRDLMISMDFGLIVRCVCMDCVSIFRRVRSPIERGRDGEDR